eukprot:9499290-Alexandrium_andersonii.AAC.1
MWSSRWSTWRKARPRAPTAPCRPGPDCPMVPPRAPHGCLDSLGLPPPTSSVYPYPCAQSKRDDVLSL